MPPATHPLVVIPARLASERLPEKPLALIEGKTLLQRVYESAVSGWPGRILVATDSERIAESARSFGAEARMTSAACRSGTERVAEAARGEKEDIIINLQGDEMFVTAAMLAELAAPMQADFALRMATLRCPLRSTEDYLNPNVVKVVVDSADNALYFSRSPIPYLRDSAGRPTQMPPGVWRHLGLYAYRKDFLLEFASWEESSLERAERLEQLRALERGVPIRCPLIVAPQETLGVDTPEDLKRATAMLRSGAREAAS